MVCFGIAKKPYAGSNAIYSYVPVYILFFLTHTFKKSNIILNSGVWLGVIMAENETMTTTIEIDKELFLKFKALCVLNETTISGEIQRMIEKRVEKMTNNTDGAVGI